MSADKNKKRDLFEKFSGRRNDNIAGWDNITDFFSSEHYSWPGWKRIWRSLRNFIVIMIVLAIIWIIIIGRTI